VKHAVRALKHGEQNPAKTILFKKEKDSLGSVTVYAGKIKYLAIHLRSWTEAWIGQAPTENSVVSPWASQ